MYQRANSYFFQIHVIMGILPIHASLVNILIFSLILLFFLTILLYSLLLHFSLFAKRKQLSFLPDDIFANNSFFADEPNILGNSNCRLATCTTGFNFLRTDLSNPCKKFSNGKHDILLRELP